MSNAWTTRLQVVILGVLALIGCAVVLARLPSPEETQGTARGFGEEFVIIDDGFSGENITWVVVRNWPVLSEPDERLNDARFDQFSFPKTVLKPDGTRLAMFDTPHVYFFDGPQLTVFPITMTSSDITELHGHFRGMQNYRQMLPFLKRFERGHD